MPSPSSTMSSARVPNILSRRQIVNRVTDRTKDRSLDISPASVALLFSRPSYFVIHCQIRLDVFLPQVGLCERISPGGEGVTLSAAGFALLPSLGAGNFPATILRPGSAFSFRFSSWNMYNVYNRSSVSKVGNFHGRHWRGWLFSPGVSFRSGCFRDYEISFKL